MNEELIKLANISISVKDFRFMFIVAILMVAIIGKGMYLYDLLIKDKTYD